MKETQIKNQNPVEEDYLRENKIIGETIENIMFVYNNFKQELSMLYESSNNEIEYKYDIKKNFEEEENLELNKLRN